MIDRLAAALDIRLRQHNALLLAAGFAPEWRQRDLAAPDMVEVAAALDRILAQQEPYPAVVVDRCWNLLKSNAAAVRLVEFLVGPLASSGLNPLYTIAAAVMRASPSRRRPLF